MNAIPYLSFDGQCREAFEFYAGLLDGELFVMTYGDSPMAEDFPDRHDHVVHAYLKAGDLVLMAGDAPPGRYEIPRGVCINLLTDSVEEGARVFSAFAEGGQIIMPFEQTFWAERFGMVTDRFGTPWMVNAGQETGAAG